MYAPGVLNSMRVLYSASQASAQKAAAAATTRHIPQQPERILDAPELLDDFCEFVGVDGGRVGGG